MDACLSPQRAKEMKELAESVRGVKGVHNIRLRKSGPVSFGEMHIEVQRDLPLDRAHVISSEVEDKIKKRFKDVESITIHAGPAQKAKIKIAIPILEDKGLESKASLHFGNASHFAFIEIENGQVKEAYTKTNEAAKLTQKKGIMAAHLVVNEKVDMVLTGGLGEGPFHVLSDSLVQIYYLPKPVKIDEAVRLLNQGILERLVSPIEKHGRNGAE
jgi:predicted Fe-Mo cluster-binding NifX family protein